MGGASLSVVIPVYNAEPNLPALVGQLVPALEARAPRFEVILVDDGSRDRSWEIMRRLSEEDARVRAIRLGRNYGQHNALLCGIREAQNDVVVTMDDDLQHPVSELPALLAKIAEGYDVVYGYPRREQHGFFRDLASRMTKVVLKKAMGAATARHVSAFRAFRTRLRNAFETFRSPFVSIDVLLTWATSNFAAIAVEHAPRRAGASNYTVRKLVQHAFNLMTGFSTLPLQVASLAGFLCTLFGIGVLAYVLVRTLLVGSPVQGFPFLASIIAIFSGAQLFAMGIFGEYLARMHFRTMDRPAYMVLESSRSPARDLVGADG